MPELAAAAIPECGLMPLRGVVEYREEWSRLVVRIGTGTCPHCRREMTAEAALRGYCPYPDCAGEILAVLGGRA
jgi:hypothetical protein